MSHHPLTWIRPTCERGFLGFAAAITLVLMVAMNSIGRPLQTPDSPLGIVSFQLAGDLDRAQRMVSTWGESGRLAAGLSLGLDFLFLFAYPALIGLTCVLVARSLQARLRGVAALGVVLAWALPAAGVLDAVENYALIRLLLGASQPAWPAVAQWCAVVKFAIVGAGLAFVLIFGAAAIVLSQRRVSTP